MHFVFFFPSLVKEDFLVSFVRFASHRCRKRNSDSYACHSYDLHPKKYLYHYIRKVRLSVSHSVKDSEYIPKVIQDQNLQLQGSSEIEHNLQAVQDGQDDRAIIVIKTFIAISILRPQCILSNSHPHENSERIQLNS